MNLSSEIKITDFKLKDSSLKFNELPSQVTEVHQPVCTSVHDPVQTFTIRHNKTSLKVDLWNNSRHGLTMMVIQGQGKSQPKYGIWKLIFSKKWPARWCRKVVHVVEKTLKNWTFECLMDVKNVSKRKLARKCIFKLYLMRGWEQNNFD